MRGMMLRKLTFGLGAFLSITSMISMMSAVSPVEGAEFRVGVARVEITPPPALPMYGYMSRTHLSTGTLDPLYARVLVLEAGGQRLALVTLDLGRTFGQAWLDRLAETTRKSSGISCMFVTASHTHAGPNILDEYPAGNTPSWEGAALDKIAKAIDDATSHAVEAKVGAGHGRVYVGYNRRQVKPDGTATMLWQNPDKLPTSPLDPTVSILRFDSVNGEPLAVLVNYACHPVVFGPDNFEYSADFVGVMAKTVEQSMGASLSSRLLCFFLQGGDGDINPYYATTPLTQDAIGKRDWTGEQLGQEASRVAREIHTEAPAHPSLQFARDVLSIGVRWNPERFRQGLLDTLGPRVFEDHAELLKDEPVKKVLPMAVTTVLINRTIAVVGLPGEPFVDLQINCRDRCPTRYAFLVGYTNGYYDYFPTIRAAAEGGYGAGDSDTYVEVGAGERMIDHALIRIYEMLGRLSDAPEELKKPD
jgi:neutral ceramidase